MSYIYICDTFFIFINLFCQLLRDYAERNFPLNKLNLIRARKRHLYSLQRANLVLIKNRSVIVVDVTSRAIVFARRRFDKLLTAHWTRTCGTEHARFPYMLEAQNFKLKHVDLFKRRMRDCRQLREIITVLFCHPLCSISLIMSSFSDAIDMCLFTQNYCIWNPICVWIVSRFSNLMVSRNIFG